MSHNKGKLVCEVSGNNNGGWGNPTQRVKISDEEGCLIAGYGTAGIEYPDDEENEANAKRLVQCWNSHDALVEQVGEYKAMLEVSKIQAETANNEIAKRDSVIADLVEALERVCNQYQNVRDADSQFDGIPSKAISEAMEVLKSAKGE